jgi:hypothetical protein
VEHRPDTTTSSIEQRLAERNPTSRYGERAITVLADGTPLYPAEWHAHPAAPPSPPRRPRFLSGGPGAPGLEPLSRPLPREIKTAVGAAPQARAPQGSLEPRVVGWAGGSNQAPPPGGSGSAEPVDTPPQPAGADADAHRGGSRKVGENLSAPTAAVETEQRALRFARLRTARSILRGESLALCMRYARDAEHGVDVMRYEHRAGYRGWRHCGSRLCPWCSAKLAQNDTAKAEKFIRGWVKRGNALALCHYTLRHKLDEKPESVWDAQTRVLQSLHSGRPWREFVEEFGLLEHIYGNEVTDGQNGCHKHQHRVWEIRMCDELKTRAGRRAFARRMQEKYRKLYLAALARNGRSALPEYALKLSIAAPTMRNAKTAAEYVTKFAKETQQGGIKSGSRGNKTVFELLDIAADKTVPETERRKSRARYAELYFGLRGKHWSYFSESGEPENESSMDESETPQEQFDDVGTVVMTLTPLQAAMIADQDMQCYLLELVEQMGVDAARDWVREFCDRRRWSRQFLDRFRSG